MTITKEQAIKYFTEKKREEVRTIREFALVENPERNWFLINENYIVRFMQAEAMNCFMRNQNFKPRISGMKVTKTDVLHYLTSNKIYAK